MWNLLRMRKNQDECSRLRDALENVTDLAALSSTQQEHLAACPACQEASSDISTSRIVLRDVPARAASPGPWFASRVMAAIAAKESELRQSLDAWAAVPRLAARLTWLSALALLVASTWLHQLPKSTPVSGNEGAAESLFDSPQSSAPQEDVVLPLENAR
jgi:hypothetical protein